MNDAQLDHLLERLKTRTLREAPEPQADAVLLARFRRSVIRRGALARVLAAAAMLALVFGIGWRLGWLGAPSAPTALSGRKTAEDVGEASSPFGSVMELFPEHEVAVVNGELAVGERHAAETERLHLRMEITAPDGRPLVTLEFSAADGRRLVLDQGPLHGNLMVSRCSEQETLVDFDLTWRNERNSLSFDDILPVRSRERLTLPNHCTITIQVMS